MSLLKACCPQCTPRPQADNPAVTALDLVHPLAFRPGLGASLFAAPYAHLTPEDARSFAHTAFSKEDIAVIGTSIDSGLLGTLSRVHGLHPQVIFIGYGTTAPNLQELAVLKAFLSPHPHLKWAHGSASPLFEGLPTHARIEPVLLPYTDAALFGVLVQAPTIKEVHDAGKIAVKVLKGAVGEVKAEELKKAVSKAKFEAASALEQREGLVGTAITQLLKGKVATLEATFASLHKVDGSALTKAASALTMAKPVLVAVGDIHGLPFADELGL